MIEWLQKEDFWEVFDSKYKPNSRYLNEVAYFECSLQDLIEITDTEAIESPLDEGDFPGPVSRWYSLVNGDLVLVTFHHHQTPFVDLEFEDDSESKVYENVSNEFKKYGFNVVST